MLTEKAFQNIQRMVLSNNFDANETLFLERELTQLRAKMFDVVFPPSKARSFAPKATDIAASADTYSFKVYRPVGMAKIVAYKGGDIPRVDVVADEVLGKVKPIGAAYGWDINELREAARLGTQLSEAKARAAKDFIERGIDEVLAKGSLADESGAYPNFGMNGLVNNSLVEGLGILTGGWWLNPTPLAATVVLADLAELASTITNYSSGTFNADTILLPTAHYEYIRQAVFSTLNGESILTVFLRNNPQIKMVAPWHKLNTAGATNKPRAITYQRDPMILEAVIPQEFEVMPPEMKGFEFINNCHARCGGVKVYQPLAMRYMDFDVA
jgi:hypothetical protein